MSFASYLAPIDYRGNMVTAALFLPALGVALSAHHTEGSSAANDVTFFGFAGGLAGLSALSLVDLALTRPVSSYTLYRHQQRLLKHGPNLRRAEVEQIERDYALTERDLPRWSFGVPLMVGGVVAFAPVFDGAVSDGDRRLAALMGAGTFGQGVLISILGAAAEGNDYGSYVEELRKFELAPIGPAGSAGATLHRHF